MHARRDVERVLADPIDEVERMSGFFDAVATQLSAYLDYKWDAEEEGRAIEAEMRREMEAEYHGW